MEATPVSLTWKEGLSRFLVSFFGTVLLGTIVLAGAFLLSIGMGVWSWVGVVFCTTLFISVRATYSMYLYLWRQLPLQSRTDFHPSLLVDNIQWAFVWAGAVFAMRVQVELGVGSENSVWFSMAGILGLMFVNYLAVAWVRSVLPQELSKPTDEVK